MNEVNDNTPKPVRGQVTNPTALAVMRSMEAATQDMMLIPDADKSQDRMNFTVWYGACDTAHKITLYASGAWTAELEIQP